jgi:hypothetical protein
MDQPNNLEQTSQATTSAQGKSRKGLYVVIGIVVVIVIIVLVSRSSSRVMNGVNINGANVSQGLDGSATYSNSEGTVTVGTNKLPDNWPSDVPAYSNATIQYSGSSNPQTGEKGSAVAFTTSDSAQKVADFYKKELASKGWTIEQNAAVGASTMLSAKKDTRTLGVYIVDAGNGQVAVTVGISMPGAQ